MCLSFLLNFVFSSQFNVIVAVKYMEHFNFFEVNLVEALRMFLRKVPLVGETHEREKVLQSFICQYNQCNPSFLEGDADTLHVLVCATVLLNTDLHGPKVAGRKRMTRKQFTGNLLGVTKKNLPSSLLKLVYNSISKESLPKCVTTSKTAASVTRSPSAQTNSKKSTLVSRSQSMNHSTTHKIRPLPIFRDDEGRRVAPCRSSKIKTLPRKQSVLWRKSIVEDDGSKTAKGKRTWKLVVAALQGLELHLAKKDSHDSYKVALHHCLAEIEERGPATKRSNVFRLTLANRSCALYQTSSKEDQETWVCAINRNAALLSAAPLSAGVGSSGKFQRPLMPSACSTLPLSTQLDDQKDRLQALCNELHALQSHPPQPRASAAEKHFYKDKAAYLLHEIRKYEVYTDSLKKQLAMELNITSGSNPPDTHSLLSVSPSEPGVVNSPLEVRNSTSDLLGQRDPAPQSHPATSPLLPTSSLPNLQPPTQRSLEASLLPPTFTKPPVLSPHSSSPQPHLKVLSRNRNQSNNGSGPLAPIVFSTSYLSHQPHVIKSQSTSKLPPTSGFSSLPRVRGRKERRGASRHSYLHAVQDETQL